MLIENLVSPVHLLTILGVALIVLGTRDEQPAIEPSHEPDAAAWRFVGLREPWRSG